jgi:hypothetical protein
MLVVTRIQAGTVWWFARQNHWCGKAGAFAGCGARQRHGLDGWPRPTARMDTRLHGDGLVVSLKTTALLGFAVFPKLWASFLVLLQNHGGSLSDDGRKLVFTY